MAELHDPRPTLPASLAHLGALVGDPVRTAILLCLSDGRRRPASELARLAGASPQAASAHLQRLVAGGLLRAEPRGRHRFFTLASGEIAETLEQLANWLHPPDRRLGSHDRRPCAARLCYDHLAGHLGVAIFDCMSARGFFAVGAEGPALGEAGAAWCRRLGLPIEPVAGHRRPLVRLCDDWTERRPHAGGRFGAALAAFMLEHDLIRHGPQARVVRVTLRGTSFLCDEFGLRWAKRREDDG